MSDIPTELYHDILKRVPLDSLILFRSVCKTWLRIIDDPTFPKDHINRGIGGDLFFHKHENGKLFVLPIKYLICSQTYNKRIDAINVKNLVGRGVPRMRDFPVPCCNGLILLSSCNANLFWRIWNPLTGESLEIKQCHEFANVIYREGDKPNCGIGYDEANDDYKVVRIVTSQTFIYSVNLEEWHKIDVCPNFRIARTNGAFAYGALHWVACSRISSFVVALDLSTEKYRKIRQPSEITKDDKSGLLNALSGCLFISCFQLEEQFCVWMIKDYGCGDTWTKIISIPDLKYMITTPVAYLKSKKQVLIHQKQFLHFRQDEYFWCDLRTKCSEKVGIEVTQDLWSSGSEYIGGNFTSQVFPANLNRLKRSVCSDEVSASEGTSKGSASQGTLKRKRKGATASERLPLDIRFREAEDWTSDSDDEPA